MRQKRYDSDLTNSQWERISRYFATDRKILQPTVSEAIP
jgi:hypothetical protein